MKITDWLVAILFLLFTWSYSWFDERDFRLTWELVKQHRAVRKRFQEDLYK